jgi:hypothetical protein
MMSMLKFPVWMVALGAAFCDASSDQARQNMNEGGVPYSIANAPYYDTEELAKSYEYFDVYSLPIKTLYSQVHWTSHGNLPLPDDVIKRYEDGKVMALMGYEVDQVRTDPKTGEEVSLPITWAYNHHYIAFMLNTRTRRVVEKPVTDATRHMIHGSEKVWTVEPVGGALTDEVLHYPHSQFISEGNGGEMRKSYHGYPKGYAQLVQSPDAFNVVPMQIDTWNREMMNATFLPGPLPKASQIRDGAAGYNPLVECPCSDRLDIEWGMTYSLDTNSCDGEEMLNASECFKAAQDLIPSNKVSTKTVSDASVPKGCAASIGIDGSLYATWNQHHSSHNEENTSVDVKAVVGETRKVVGVVKGVVNVTISMDATDNSVTITMLGPQDKWFGLGFGTDSMCVKMEADECPSGGPYAIIVMGDTVVERKLDYHGAGRILDKSVDVQSNEVDGDIRMIQLTRPLEGLTDTHYTFDVSQAEIKLIMATGCSTIFAQHCGHQAGQASFLPTDTPKHVCRAGIKGSIGGSPFHNHCAPFPKSVLADQNNPTCSIQTYRGGQNCCRHGHFLLDKDQDIPWKDQPLEYRLKFRFYFEDYREKSEDRPASHKALTRLYWQTEAWASEYDVPQCKPGTPPSQCIHVITSQMLVRDIVDADKETTAAVELIYAAPHCHAPTCISMELYRADTGELLCHMDARKGSGSLEQYDEKGYLALAPCLWSSQGEHQASIGLPLPVPLLIDTPLLSIKRANATWPHTGEMASWQMRGFVIPKETIGQEQATARVHSLRATANVRDQKDGV